MHTSSFQHHQRAVENGSSPVLWPVEHTWNIKTSNKKDETTEYNDIWLHRYLYHQKNTNLILKEKQWFLRREIKATSRLLGLMSGLSLAPQTQPIRDKRKTNWVFLISIFPRLAWIYSSLWLAAYIVCVVCCDWLADLTSILHAQRALLGKTRANRERTNTISKAATDNFNESSNIFVIFSWARLATCTCGHFLCINCRGQRNLWHDNNSKKQYLS